MVRVGDYKLIWGESNLLPKNIHQVMTFKKHSNKKTKKHRYIHINKITKGMKQLELYNVFQDPFETKKLSVTKHKHIVEKLKKIVKENYPQARFPKHHKNEKAAFPGNNDGLFVTGWCI